jgi:hypothetical protein
LSRTSLRLPPGYQFKMLIKPAKAFADTVKRKGNMSEGRILCSCCEGSLDVVNGYSLAIVVPRTAKPNSASTFGICRLCAPDSTAANTKAGEFFSHIIGGAERIE